MKKFVVFDLDGTLLDTIPDIANAMNRSLKQFGLPSHPFDAYKVFTGNGALMLTKRALNGREELLDQVYEAYSKDYGVNNQVDTAPYQGIPELLKFLNEEGIGIIVYSNKGHADTQEVIRHYFPDIRFLAVQGAKKELPLKPDPTALNALMNELGLKPENGLYLGDTVMDMRCAKACQISAVAAFWGFQPKEKLLQEEPEYTLDTPFEMQALVKKHLDN